MKAYYWFDVITMHAWAEGQILVVASDLESARELAIREVEIAWRRGDEPGSKDEMRDIEKIRTVEPTVIELPHAFAFPGQG